MTSRQLSVWLQIAWNGSSWVDESSRVISASGSFSFANPASFLTAGGGVVDTALITLSNVGNFYNHYVDEKNVFQRHVRLHVDIGGGYQRIFSGAISSLEITAPTVSGPSQAVLQCVTQEGPYLQRKYDISAYDFRLLSDSLTTEVDWFEHILAKIGSPLTQKFDPGMIIIPWLWADDESVLEEMWTAAASAGGVLFTNIIGELVYRNASGIAKIIQTSSETLSRDNGDFSSISLNYNQDDLYSDITVEVSTRTIGAEDEIWSPGDYENLIVPPNSVITVTATYDDPVYQITRFEWEATTADGWPIGQVSVSKTDYAQKSILTITNNHASLTAYIKYFRVYGFPITGGPAFERSAHSVDAFWNGRDRRSRSVRENAYIQTPVQAQFLADLILDESQLPRVLVTVNGILGKPSRFPGNVVTIQDSKLRAGDIVGQIESLSWTLGSTYEHSIVVRDFGNIYQYKPYFVIGTHRTGGTERIFY